jgi:hypothetical protein
MSVCGGWPSYREGKHENENEVVIAVDRKVGSSSLSVTPTTTCIRRHDLRACHLHLYTSRADRADHLGG